MTVLHRYLFKQLFLAMFMASGLFIFVLVLGNVMREVIDLLASGRLDWLTFLYLLALLIPGVLPYALPMGLLTAVLLVVGRFCAQQEYTAMRAAGMSLWSLAAPVLGVACLGVLLLLFINFFYAPAADRSYRIALASLARRNPLQFFQPGADVREFSGHVISIGSKEGNELRDIWYWKSDKKNRAIYSAHARSGEVAYDAANDALVVTLKNSVVSGYNADDPENMQDTTLPTAPEETLRLVFSLRELMGPPPNPTKLSLFTLPELMHARADGPPNGSHDAKDIARWRMLVQMQIQSHFAGAFAVLALSMVALPLALRVSRAENFVNLGLALCLALGYYMLLFFVNLLHTHPEMRPDLLLWLPNFLLEGLGLWLLLRAAKQ